MTYDPVINIPMHKTGAICRKLMEEQRSIHSRHRVYFSRFSQTFYRWHFHANGTMQRQKCSRNGKRLGVLFGACVPDPIFRPRPVTTYHPPTWELKRAMQGRFDSPSVHTEAQTGRWNNKEVKMNALKIAVLCSRYEYPGESNVVQPPIGMGRSYDLAILELKRDSYIETSNAWRGYKLTQKGKVFVEHLIRQPEPVATEPQWKMPEA